MNLETVKNKYKMLKNESFGNRFRIVVEQEDSDEYSAFTRDIFKLQIRIPYRNCVGSLKVKWVDVYSIYSHKLLKLKIEKQNHILSYMIDQFFIERKEGYNKRIINRIKRKSK